MAVNADRPNRLRELRTAAGWTQQETADRLNNAAHARREKVWVIADQVSKWERGVKTPCSQYRALFAAIYGVTVAQLGFGPHRTDPPAGATPDHSLVAMLDQAAGLLDQLGPAAGALARHLLAASHDAETSRRRMLAALAATETGTPRTAYATPDELDDLADQYERLYDTAEPAALLTAATAHVRTVTDALAIPRPKYETRRLHANRARAAILAGRIAGDDFGDRLAARAHFALAADSARQAGHDDLAAAACGWLAHQAVADGLTAAADDHLDTARQLARTPAVRAWLAILTAELHTATGTGTAEAVHAADEARQHAEAREATATTAPCWTGPADTSAIDTAAARALTRSADPIDAETARYLAEQAHAALRPAETRRRALVLVLLADAALAAGDRSAARHWTDRAAKHLQRHPNASALRTLDAHHARVEQTRRRPPRTTAA